MHDTAYDFDTMQRGTRYYEGAAKKHSIILDGSTYMIKFPSKAKKKNDLITDYAHNSFSEYISCHIINALHLQNVTAQETVLGHSKGKIAVACKDFTSDDTELVTFNKIQNADVDSDISGRHPCLQDVLQTYMSFEPIAQHPEHLERFWDTFVLDALLANFDRHSGNWGFMQKRGSYELQIAPIYDCGACLYPSLSENVMDGILASPEELHRRIYDFPFSAFKNKETGNKYGYVEVLSSGQYPACRTALKKLQGAYSDGVVKQVIDSTPLLSDEQRRFYYTMITLRKEKIIDRALEVLEDEKET